MKTLLATAAILVAGIAPALADPLDGKTWDEIVTQAKQEGQLTWYVWYLQDDLRRTVKAFEDEYGIKVTIPEGEAAANADKLIAERGRETGDIDVFAWGFNDFDNLNRADFFEPLAMLPADEGRVGELAGIDGQGYVLAYWGNQTGIAYDPDQIKEEDLPQTPEEFAAFWDAHPGKFGFNYEKGGSGPSYFQNMLRVVTGVDIWSGEAPDDVLELMQPGYDFFNEHAANYVITASNADSAIRLNDRELWMAPTWEDFLTGLQKRGEVRPEIKFYIPEMGMNGGGNGVAIPKNAPHPAAAAVFIDWLTSAETQTVFNRDFGTAPMNAAADDSAALVSSEQRKNSVAWAAKSYQDAINEGFIDNVVLER